MSEEYTEEKPIHKTRKHLFAGLKSKILVYFGLLFVLTIAALEYVEFYGIPFTSFDGEYQIWQSEEFNQLNLVADLKKERLKRWVRERRDDTRIIAEGRLLGTALAQLHARIQEKIQNGMSGEELWAAVQNEGAYQDSAQLLNLVKTAYEVYENIQIADAETGVIMVSTRNADLGLSISSKDYFINALRVGESYMNIRECPQTHQIELFISHSIKVAGAASSDTGKPRAVIIAHINTDDFIIPMLHTGEGLGRSGEVLLIDRHAKILAPLKYPLPDGNIARPLEYKIKSKPAQFAARGEEGIIATQDYRGVSVLAAYRYIRISPRLGWGMVVKQDHAEIFAPLRQSIFYSLVIGFICIALALAVAYLIAVRLSRPIGLLSETARQVEAGDFNARAPIIKNASREMDILTGTFNSMIQRVQNWHEELGEQVQSRTAQLNELNQKLSRNEQQLQTLIDNMPAYISYVGADQRYRLVNRNYEETFQLSRDEIIGQYIEEVLGDATYGLVVEFIEAALSGQGSQMEVNPHLGDLGRRWMNSTYIPDTDEQGQTNGFFLLAYDITERKQMEDALRLQGEITENMSEGVYLVGVDDHKIKYTNPKFAEIFGYSPDEMVGKDASVVNAPTEMTPREMVDYIVGILKETGIWKGEIQNIKKDGTPFWCYASASLFDHPDYGEIIISVHTDISERKQMEEELLKIQKLDSIGVLAGGIAHDLNNLLTGVVGNISLARLYEDPVEKNRRLAEAEKASMLIKDLTQQLLTFSKGGAPIVETADISELLRHSATFTLRGSNVSCEFSIPDDLWPVEVDEGQINQVINNLIINSRQAMPSGGTVKIRAENATIGAESGLPLDTGVYVKISIEDEGTGIPEEHIQKIFDPFFTTKQLGNGLGLATSYSIIEKHGGYITVESQLGVGAAFYIYLPASPDGILIAEEEERKPVTGEGRILVMDDEEVIRELASNMLTSLGYQVTTVTDGAKAIETYRTAMDSGDAFDAVIVDLTIPGGMGGKETIQRLIEIDPNVRAIVSSGYSNDPILANFGRHGFKGFIAKPYKPVELSEVMHGVITGEDRE